MPVHGRPFEKGNLYVRFNVVFPTSLGPSEREKLATILPGPAGGSSTNGRMDSDDAETVHLLLLDCWMWSNHYLVWFYLVPICSLLGL